MKSKRCYLASLGVLACATAAMAQAPQMLVQSEADFSVQATRTPSPVRTAAMQALQGFALHAGADSGTLPQGFPFDVRDAGDMRNGSIGYGFQVFDADPTSLVGGASLDRSAHPTGIWRFAVILDGRPIGLMTMAQGASGWEAVSMGGAGLAKEVDAVVYAQASKAAAQLRYVRVPQATADFIEIGSADSARFVPLQAARESLRIAAGSKGGDDASLSDDQLQAQLRDAVSRNLAD
jgi:hypothetical protein